MGASNDGKVVIQIEGEWKKFFKQAQDVVDNLGESISDELYQSMEQAFSRLSKIDIDAKLVSVFNRFQNAISKTKDPLKIQNAIKQFDESAKFFESIEKMASSNGINNVFLGIDKDGLKDFMSLADKVIAKQQELLKYDNSTKEYSRNYDEMIGENGKYTLKLLDDVVKFAGYKSSDKKESISKVTDFFEKRVVGKIDKHKDTINEFGKLVGLLEKLESQEFSADDIRSVQKEMGLDIIRGQIRNLFNNSNDTTKKLINQYAKDNKVKLGIKKEPYDLQKDYGNFARATTDRINSDINDITQQAYTLILNEAQKVSESFQDRDKQIGTVLEGFAKEVAEAFNQLDETFKKKYSTKDISEIKDKLKAAYEKFANNYKGGKLTDDTFNDLKEVIGYYQRFLTLGGTESDMLGFDWFNKNHRTLVTGTSKHLTSTSYGKEIDELSKNIQLLSQVIDQVGTGVVGSGAGIGGGSGDGSGNGSGSGEGSGNGGFGSGVDKESLNEFTTAIVSKLEELKTVVNEIKNNTEQNKSQNTNGIDMNALADSIYETTTNTATIKNNTDNIAEIKRILEQEINTVINTISTSISGIDLSSIDNHLSRIGNLLDDISKLTPSLGGQNSIAKNAFGDVIDILLAQLKSDRFLMSNNKETYERAMYFGDNFISDPFFHGDKKNVPGWLMRKKILSDGNADKVKYNVHTHPNIFAALSFPFFNKNNELKNGDIKSFYDDYNSGLDIEEHLIAALNEVQVFLSKKFYNEHSDLLSKKYKIRDESGNDILTDFYNSFATDIRNYKNFINANKNLVASKKMLFDAHNMYGTFDEIVSSVDSDEKIEDNVKQIFKSNINKYIENIKNNLVNGNLLEDDVLNSILQSLMGDGVDTKQATIVASLAQGLILDNEKETYFNKALSSIISKHLLSTKKYGGINLDKYIKNYNLSNEEDVKFLHEKYGNQVFNVLKQEQENMNAKISISPDFDADEFINQIIVTIGDKKIPVKVSPDINPEDFINQILTAIGEKEFSIKIAPNDESLNELTNMIGSKLSENENLEKLNTILGEIIQKIERKNELFKEEQGIVSKSVGDETGKLDELNGSVNDVVNSSREIPNNSSSTTDALDEEEKKEQRSLETLKEKVDYLKEMKTLYEFLYGKVSETSDTGRTKGAEDKLYDWTEWGYDAGGDDKHKPKSNEQSIKRINDYEELEEKIKETKSVLEDFDMTYEEIIVTMKDGSNVILQTSDDFDKIALDIRKIKDVQFVKDFSTEIDNVHDLLDEIHAYDEENVNKQLFPPVVNFLETEEEIQDAISSLKSYKKELEDVLSGEVFNQLKSGVQDDVRSSLNYINTLIKSTETQLDIYRKMHQQTDEGHQDNKTDSKPSYLSSLSSSLDEVIEKVKEKNDLFNEEQSIVSTITESEVNDLNKVRDAVNEISEAIERKNDLLNDVQQSPTSHSSSVELNEEKSENDLTTSIEPTNIISFEELAKEEIEYTKNQIKGLKDYIFNTNSDECGLFAKYLFGEDGNLKTEKQVIAELETMIDEFYKGTRTDTEEIFRLWRAAESTNLLKGYNFDYKYMRPSYNEWLGNHDDNNQWITETERMSDEAHSMLGYLVEEEEKLSVLQKNNGEDFVNYLKEAKELKEEIYPLLDKYKNYSPSGRDAILDSDITQEHAKEKGDLLEKESDKAEELIKKYEILIEKYNEFKKNRNISDIENDPLKRYNIVNDLKDLSDKLYKESEIYSNISTLRHTSKIGEQLSIYENDTRIDKAYSDNKLYPIAERIDTGIYRGEISAQEGIEKFIAKAKELGYEFDEVANKWVRVENEVSSPIVNNPIEEVVDESKKRISELEGELGNIARSFATSFNDDAKYDFEFEKNYEIANRLKNVLEEIYKIDPSYSIEDLISRTTTSLNDAKKDIANFENILREVRNGTGKWSKNKILNNQKEFADDLIATAEEYKTLSESSERDEKALLNVEARFNAMLSAQHQLLKAESEYCRKVYNDTQNMIRDTYAEDLQEQFWDAMANGANMSSKSDLDFIVRDRLGIRYGDLMSEFDINNLQLLLNLLNNIDKVQDKISKESMISDQQKVSQHEFEIVEELSNRLRSTPEEIRNDDVEWVENQYKYIAEYLSNVEKAKAKIAELNGEIYEFKEITADDVKSNFWNIDVQEPTAQEQLNTPLSPTTDTSSKNILDETERLKELSNELEEVERRVGLKTMAFVNEKGEVEKVVNIEKSKLNELKESVESVSNSVNDLAQGLKGVSEYANNTIKLEVTNKDGNPSTSTTATTSSTDGLNNDTILNEQFFNIDDLKEKNKGVAELEKRLGGVLDVVKQIRKGKDGDYVSFRLTGEKGSAWVGANGDVLRLTTKDKTDYTDKKKKDKQDRDIWDKQYHNAIKDNFIMTQKASRKIWDKDYENAMKENYKRDYKKQRDIWDKAYSEAQKENYKFDKIDEAKNRKIWDVDYEKAIKENYLRDLKSNRKIWDDAYNAAYKENRKRYRKIWDKDYNNAYKENYKRDQDVKKEQERQDANAKKEQEKKEAQRQKLYAKDAFDQVAAQKKEQEKQEKELQKIIEKGNKKIQQREEAKQKRLNKMSMDQAKGDAKRRINALETASKLSSSENKYFTDSYYKNLFESQVSQSATATFKDQKDATHWQGALVENEMQAIIDAQSKLIAAEKEFDKVKKNFDNDSITYADRYTEVVKKLNNAREEFAKLNADEFYKGNKTGISNDLVEKYEKQNTTLKDTLLARESRNNSNGVEGDTNEVLEKRRERLLKLIEVFDVYLSKINSYPEHAEKIKQTHDQLELLYNGSPDLVSDDDLNKIDRFGKQLRNVDKLAKENRIEKLIGSITEFMRRNSKMSRESADEFQNLINKLKNGNLLESEIDGISTSFEKLKTRMRETGEVGRSFFDVFKQKITYLTAQQLAMYFSFNDIIRYSRTIIQNITEINTQFTELAKVSDTSIEQLNADFKSYTSTAKEVGSTISDTISATADWARMGYNIPDSKELAKVALLYKNVGDGIDISTANESLISTLQGFQIEANDAIEVVDKFNEVSNNFAISSGGIGEALKRSAASFNAANTDLSKSIALVTTTNTVLQDPQVVGNLWKTMSARLRGAKTELEDLGEEEDEFTESTSKLQKLVKGLTGFDIMKDDDTFKDLYDIMIGIGEKWQDLTDIERASLGEALAGKRMANGLYAVLNNLDTLKSAYNTAENSAGSAMREQENYQKSIQYSVEVLKASFQELSNELINSDTVKFVVDIANGLVNISSEVVRLTGLIPALTAAVASLASVKNNLGFFRTYDVTDKNGNTVSKFGTLIGENRYNNKEIIKQNKISKIGSKAISKYGKLLGSGVPQAEALSIAFDGADAKLNKFVNGSLKDFVSGYDNANDALTAWNEKQNESIEIYKSSTNAANKATGAINLLGNAAKGIGNMLVFGLVAKVLEKAVTVFGDIAKTNNDIEWIGSSANSASNKIKEMSESVDDYKNKITELYKTINDKSSTDEQVIKARTDLLDLQKQMIEKYGSEESKLQDITKATLGYVDALDSLKAATYQEQKNEFDKKKDFFEDPSDWVYKKSQNYSGQIDQMVQEYLTTQTETLDMDALKVDLSKLSEEKLNALKELGVQLKVYNGDSQDDPIGRKWLRNISDNKAFSTGLLYKVGKADKENTRDFDPLTDSLSETNGLMLQIDANGKDMKNTILGIQEIFKDEEGLDEFNNKLAEIAENWTKIDEAYKDFSPSYVLNDLINNKYDGLPLEDYLNDIEDAKDAYEKAFNSGNKKDILKTTMDYMKTVGDKQSKLYEFVDDGKLSEENAQIISDYFQDAFSDTMDAAIENLKITIDLSKNIDIKSIKENGLSQEDINDIYRLYMLYYDNVQKVANKAKANVVSNSDITPFLGIGENYGLNDEQTKDIVDGYKNVIGRISKETNPDAYWSALAGKASEFSKWYEHGISAEDYEAIAKLIISNATKNADKDLQNAIDDGLNDAAKELGMSTEDFMKVYGSATNGLGHLFEYCKENGLELEWVLNMLGVESRKLEEEQDKLFYDMVKGIKETKDSAKSLMDTLEKLRSGDLSSEELIDFLGNEDNKEFIQSVNNLEDKLIASIKTKRKETLESVKELADEERTYWEGVINDTYDKLESSAHLEVLNSSIDKLQEGLKTLSSAFDEYNENGFITLDTLQALTAENGEYLSMLTIEDGQLKINEEAYKSQVAAKLNDLKTTLSEAAANEINALAQAKANGETEKGVVKLNALSIAYETATASAAAFAREQGVTDEEINEIIDKYDTIFNKAADGFNNNFKVFSGATTSSAGDTADTLKEELDNYIAYQDALLDAGKISYDEYTKNVRGKLDSLYSSGKLTAKDYFDYVQKLLEKQLSIYDEVLSAVARRYDKEIEKIDDQIEAINEENDALNKQKDEYDKILSVVQEVYDKEIESLHGQQDAIQDKIDALQKANDEEDRALALANARYALEKAQQQRTRLVYNGAEGFVYQTDPEAIRNAKKELKDAELENTVAALEEEKEALDKTIENLEEYKEKWSEISEVYDKEVNRQLAIALWGENYEQMILQNREQDIQDFTNKYVDLQKKVNDNTSLIESFEEKKKYYEELKAQWQEITDIYKNSIEDQHTAMVLGADWENEILSGRTTALEKFKNEYIAIQEQIKQAAIDSANAQAAADKGGSGSSSGGGFDSGMTVSSDKKAYEVINSHGGNATGAYYSTKEEAEEARKAMATKDPRDLGSVREITGVSGFKILRQNANGTLQKFGNDKLYDTYEDAVKVLNDPNSEYNKKLNEGWKFVIKLQKFAKGGVINANNNNPLNGIASKLGEDTAVLARHGERILTPIQNQYWEKWTNAIPNLTKHLEQLKFNIPNLSSILNAVASKETTVKQEISISLPNVTNTSGAEYVLNALKTLPLEAVQRVNRR